MNKAKNDLGCFMLSHPEFALPIERIERIDIDESDCCEICGSVLSARELRDWRCEFGIEADEPPHMQDTPALCDECEERDDWRARR